MQLADGTLLPVRCKCPNKCEFCGFMGTLEYAQMVLDDATDFQPPRLGLALTTQREHTSPETFQRDVEQVRKYLRRELRGYEGLAHIEYTTGNGRRSGGVRRIHAHELTKTTDESLTDGDRLALEHGVRRIWQKRTGAHRVELAELRSPAGAAHYLTNHHSKRTQLPPAGWTGRRYRPTRGYFSLPAPERRQRAKESLLDKNLARRVRQTLNADPDLVDVDGEQWNEFLAADLQAARAIAAQGVTLVRVQTVPIEFGPDWTPTRWETQVLGPATEIDL